MAAIVQRDLRALTKSLNNRSMRRRVPSRFSLLADGEGSSAGTAANERFQADKVAIVSLLIGLVASIAAIAIVA